MRLWYDPVSHRMGESEYHLHRLTARFQNVDGGSLLPVNRENTGRFRLLGCASRSHREILLECDGLCIQMLTGLILQPSYLNRRQ